MTTTDLSFIRWQRLRWDFVNAMVHSSRAHADGDRLLCTDPACCLGMAVLVPELGMEIRPDEPEPLAHRMSFLPHVTAAMRDGMTMVSTFFRFGRGNPLEGFMEVPMEVGNIIHADYFTGFEAERAVHASHEPADPHRELLLAFVQLAFPDDFLREVHADRGAGR